MPFLCIHIVLALLCQDHLLFPASAVLHGEVAGCRGEHWRVLGRWEEEVEGGSMGLVVPSWGHLPCRSITRADSSYGKCSGKQLRGCNSSRGSHWDTAFTAEGSTWRRVTEKENVYYFPLQDNSFYLCFFDAEIVNNNFQSKEGKSALLQPHNMLQETLNPLHRCHSPGPVLARSHVAKLASIHSKSSSRAARHPPQQERCSPRSSAGDV